MGSPKQDRYAMVVHTGPCSIPGTLTLLEASFAESFRPDPRRDGPNTTYMIFVFPREIIIRGVTVLSIPEPQEPPGNRHTPQ